MERYGLGKIPGNLVVLNHCTIVDMDSAFSLYFVGFEDMVLIDVTLSNVRLEEVSDLTMYKVNFTNCILNNSILNLINSESLVFHNITFVKESTIVIEYSHTVEVSNLMVASDFGNYHEYLMSFKEINNIVFFNGLIQIDSQNDILIEFEDSFLNMNSKIKHALKGHYQTLSMQHAFSDSRGLVTFRSDETRPLEIVDSNSITGPGYSECDISCSTNFKTAYISDSNLLSILCIPISKQYYTLAESNVYFNHTTQQFSTTQNTHKQFIVRRRKIWRTVRRIFINIFCIALNDLV